MHKFKAVLFIGILSVVSGLMVHGAAAAEDPSGEALFKKNCAVCHVDGGNIINPQKTLHKKDRDANDIKTADDIINKMRHPGPGMTIYDVITRRGPIQFSSWFHGHRELLDLIVEGARLRTDSRA